MDQNKLVRPNLTDWDESKNKYYFEDQFDFERFILKAKRWRSMQEEKSYKTLITARHKLFDLHLAETFQYRDLIGLIVKKNFISQYKQTALGPLWAIIQPLMTTIVFTIIFGNLAGLTTSDTREIYRIPSFLFYMIGNSCWSYFSSTLTATSNTFIANRDTMGKVYYPRLVAPIATALSNLISFAIQLSIFAILWIVFLLIGGTDIKISGMIILLPLCVFQLSILSTGIGIIISAVTTKYRDLQMIVGFGLELWRYGCPIAYGLMLVPEKYLFVYMLNPVTPIITTIRTSVFGFGYFSLYSYCISWLMTSVLFFVGLVMFSRIERTFMDTI